MIYRNRYLNESINNKPIDIRNLFNSSIIARQTLQVYGRHFKSTGIFDYNANDIMSGALEKELGIMDKRNCDEVLILTNRELADTDYGGIWNRR